MKLDAQQQSRILTPAVRRLMAVAQSAGGELRVVGGAVRDAVRGGAVGDIDLAATLPPDRMMDILSAQGIKTVPTGLAHGTVTAVIDHVGYEITTLRHDVATDGRRATVAFTDDWQGDAARRDFTMNALYADADGTLYDYFDGVAAARAGHVRFIGDATQRIREDVLRILRFFRFFAWFGHGDADAEALAACRELAASIPALSAERVARETLKLLGAPDPLAAWTLMLRNGVALYVAAKAADVARLRALLQNEKKFGEPQAPLTRLAALLPQDKTVAANVAARLKLSTRDAGQLAALSFLPGLVRAAADSAALRRLIYAHGADAVRAAVFLEGSPTASALVTLAAWDNPVFPLKGEDIVGQGIPAGPRVGDILRATEEWWIAGDFRAPREACRTFAAEYGKNH